MAAEADPETPQRDTQPLIGTIARGKEVTVVLEGQGLEVDNRCEGLSGAAFPASVDFR